MTPPVGLYVALALVAILLPIVVVRRSGSGDVVRFIERKSLMTAAELRMLGIIEQALPEWRVCPQVAMGALLKVKHGVDAKRFWSVRNRFGQKVVDFAVVDRLSGEVVAIIELDDRLHDADKDAQRDRLLLAGDYIVARFPTRPWPTVAAVAAAMRPYLRLDSVSLAASSLTR